ncbi:MAG: tail fiber domain-containing protein, partial [Cytophagales bacterium]
NDLHPFGATAGQVLTFGSAGWRPANTTNLLSGKDIRVLSGRINVDAIVDSSIQKIIAPTSKNLVLQNSIGQFIVLDSIGNGSVGIGTNAPSAKLHVVSPNTTGIGTNMVLGQNIAIDKGPGSTQSFTIGNNTGTSGLILASGPTAGVVLKWEGSYADLQTLNNQSLIINRGNTGNLGIGISSFTPTHLLHVGGTGKNVRFEAYSGVGARMLYVNSSGEVRDTTYPIGGTDLLSGYDIKVVGNRINLDQVIDSVTTINAFGSGLNVNATGTQNINFNVADGRVNIASSTPTNLALQVTGRIKSNALTEVSDARLKKDVKELENALALVKQMQGVSYKWKKDSLNGRTEIGVIAQEMEKLVPEVVDTDSEGFKSVQYSHLVAYLIEAIKEQQEMIAKQQQEIEQLKSSTDLNQLKSSIEILMQRVAELESVQYKEAKR